MMIRLLVTLAALMAAIDPAGVWATDAVSQTGTGTGTATATPPHQYLSPQAANAAAAANRRQGTSSASDDKRCAQLASEIDAEKASPHLPAVGAPQVDMAGKRPVDPRAYDPNRRAYDKRASLETTFQQQGCRPR